MTVLSVSKRVGSEISSDKNERRITERYFVTTSSISDDAFDVLTSRLIPVRGQQHPTDRACRVEKVSLNQSTPLRWIADVEYSSRVDPLETKDHPPPQEGTTEFRAPDIFWGSETEDVYDFFDLDGKPFVNSIGDPLDNIPPRKEHVGLLRIEVDIPLIRLPFIDKFTNAVNSDTFLGAPPETVLIDKISAPEMFENGVRYSRLSIEFKKKNTINLNIGDGGIELPGGVSYQKICRWDEVRLNEGYLQYSTDPIDGRRVKTPILDDTGRPVSRPKLLTHKGYALDFDPLIDPVSKVVWRYFRIRERRAFADLNLERLF